jgi:hypothetical protein
MAKDASPPRGRIANRSAKLTRSILPQLHATASPRGE